MELLDSAGANWITIKLMVFRSNSKDQTPSKIVRRIFSLVHGKIWSFFLVPSAYNRSEVAKHRDILGIEWIAGWRKKNVEQYLETKSSSEG